MKKMFYIKDADTGQLSQIDFEAEEGVHKRVAEYFMEDAKSDAETIFGLPIGIEKRFKSSYDERYYSVKRTDHNSVMIYPE